MFGLSAMAIFSIVVVLSEAAFILRLLFFHEDDGDGY